jgi:hypothetical protein
VKKRDPGTDVGADVAFRRTIQGEIDALTDVLHALVGMDFEQRRRILRWACDRYGLDPARLGQ